MTSTLTHTPTTRWHVVPQGTIVSITSTPDAATARRMAAAQPNKCRVLTTAQLALSTVGTLPYAD